MDREDSRNNRPVSEYTVAVRVRAQRIADGNSREERCNEDATQSEKGPVPARKHGKVKGLLKEGV